MDKKKKDAEKKLPVADEHEGEDGYASVEDEKERTAVDKKQVISDPG